MPRAHAILAPLSGWGSAAPRLPIPARSAWHRSFGGRAFSACSAHSMPSFLTCILSHSRRAALELVVALDDAHWNAFDRTWNVWKRLIASAHMDAQHRGVALPLRVHT